MPLMAIDPVAASLSKRIAAKTGTRASEIYIYAAPLMQRGIEPERVEEILSELLEMGSGMTIHEIMELVAQQDMD